MKLTEISSALRNIDGFYSPIYFEDNTYLTNIYPAWKRGIDSECLIFESNKLFGPSLYNNVLTDVHNFYGKYGEMETNIKEIIYQDNKIIFIRK